MKRSGRGETRYSSGITPTDYRYTGQLEQTDVNLYYYNARYYDAALGRFIQADTIVPGAGNAKSYDRYAYVNNNPLRYTDPSGRHIFEDDPHDEANTYFLNPYISYLYYGTFTAQRVTKYSSVMYSELGEKEPVNFENRLPVKEIEGKATFLDSIIPSHGGVRIQGEFSIETPIPKVGDVGFNVVYNRISKQAAINMDYSLVPGFGLRWGASVTGGLFGGWFSSDINHVVSGVSRVIWSITAACEEAYTTSASIPINMDGTAVYDPYFDTNPVTYYFGYGKGAAYASLGTFGRSWTTDTVIDISDYLPEFMK